MAWPEAIFFDFDGVILESVDVKSTAFGRLFSNYPDHLPEILALHERLGGISRFEKFRMIYQDILKMPYDASRAATLGKEFAGYVVDEVLACPMVVGAQDFLSQYARTLPIFVISGTPEDELYDIIVRRGLREYFREVHGSPKTKPEIIRDILNRFDWCANRVLLVGDAESDYLAAQVCGLRFIGRVGGKARPFQEDTVITPDLTSLGTLISQMFA